MSTNNIIEISWNIQIECFPKLNFSLQQSNIPFIKNISINNNTDEAKNNIKLQVSSTPEFISPKTFEICGKFDQNIDIFSRVAPDISKISLYLHINNKIVA